MWFPSHVILYCWLNGTALQGHRVSRNWTFTDCTVQWSWLHPGQQLFPQPHMWLSITPHWIPHWGVCEAAHNGAACEVLALSHVPQEGTALLSHSTGRAKEPFSNWCKLVKPSTFSFIPLRLKLFSVWEQICLPIGLLCPKFYRILSLVLVEGSLIYITNCKTKITKYNKIHFSNQIWLLSVS